MMAMPPPPPPVNMSGAQHGLRVPNVNGPVPPNQMQHAQGLGISPSLLTEPHGNQNYSQHQSGWQQRHSSQFSDPKRPVYEVYVIRRNKATPASWRNPPQVSTQHVSDADLDALRKVKTQSHGQKQPVLVQYDGLKHDLMRDAVDKAVEDRNAKEENKHLFKWELALLDVKLKPVGNSMFPSRFETTQIRVVVKRELRPGVSPEMAANAIYGPGNGLNNAGVRVSRVNGSAPTNGAFQHGLPHPNGRQGQQGMPGIPPPPPAPIVGGGMYPQHQQQQQQQFQQFPQPVNGSQAHGSHMMNIPPPPLNQFPRQQQQPSMFQNQSSMPGLKKNQNKATQKAGKADQKVKQFLQDLSRSPVFSESEDEQRHRRKGRKSAQTSPRSSGNLDRRHHGHHRRRSTRRIGSDAGSDFDQYSSDYSSDDNSAYTPPSSVSDNRRHRKDKHANEPHRVRDRSRDRRPDGGRYIERERDLRRKNKYDDAPIDPRRPRENITRVAEDHRGRRPSAIDDYYEDSPYASGRLRLLRSQSTRIGGLPHAPTVPRRDLEQDRFAQDQMRREREHAAYLAGGRYSKWAARSPTLHREALSEVDEPMFAAGGRTRGRDYRDVYDHVEDEFDWVRHEPVRTGGDRWR